MSSLLKIQIELPVNVVNKTYSYLQGILGRDSNKLSLIPAVEWGLTLLRLRNIPQEAEYAIRDYARSACMGMQPFGLSFVVVQIDKSGNISLPARGSVSKIEECISELQDTFKKCTGFDVDVNSSHSLVVGHLSDENSERTIEFRRPVSWTAGSICLARADTNGINQRLFVLFFEGGQDVTVHG